jgi:pyrroline-5-carboxylate reductase
MVQRGMKEIMVSEPRGERRAYLENQYGVKTTPENKEVVGNCNVIILAVKPQNMDEVTAGIYGLISPDKLIVSIAAGITLSYLTSRLKTSNIIRVMPNTPALVQEGMSVLSLCECIPDKDMSIIRDIFMSVGKVIVLPEKYMDAVTAVSGSGPGFIAYFVECMIEAGIRVGLNKDNASELAVQTFIGTAKLLETGMPPDKLREMVTSPGGTTAAGLKAFEQKGLEDTVSAGVQAAVNRSKELGRKE